MPLRLVLLFALASAFLVANEQKQVSSCCEPGSEKLPQSQVKALVKKTEPIHAHMLRGYASHQRNRCLGDFC